jgi:choloylglycine hydrolase
MLVLAIFFVHETASTCTSIVLIASDGAAVYGRTMEWGAFDLNSRLVIVPRGFEFQGHTPDGKPCYRWKARYGAVALDAIGKDYLTDGMNEKGLVVGVLYLPGFSEFQPYDPALANISMSSAEFGNYVLTEFATVNEVREGLKKIRVVPVPEPALGGIPAPFHSIPAHQENRRYGLCPHRCWHRLPRHSWRLYASFSLCPSRSLFANGPENARRR